MPMAEDSSSARSVPDPAWLERIRRGDRRALARLITRIDDGEPGDPWLAALGASAGRRPCVVGITGPPGAGKSSLIGALIPAIRKRGLTVAVLAVDPQSPFTGGALLGDRIRMNRHAPHDPGVLIRSLSTRGAAGGLSPATGAVARLLAAAGFDLVLVETVGAGQADWTVMDAADVVALVLNPGTGDGIQWEKAGQMEVADLFVLNKADLPGIDALEGSLRAALELPPEACDAERAAPVRGAGRPTLWDGLPPIVRTVCSEGVGVDAVLDAMLAALARVSQRRVPEHNGHQTGRLLEALRAEFAHRLQRERHWLDRLAARVSSGELSLEAAAAQAWQHLAEAGGTPAGAPVAAPQLAAARCSDSNEEQRP